MKWVKNGNLGAWPCIFGLLRNRCAYFHGAKVQKLEDALSHQLPRYKILVFARQQAFPRNDKGGFKSMSNALKKVFH